MSLKSLKYLKITYEGFSDTDIKIILLMANDVPTKLMPHILWISQRTIEGRKRVMKQKAGVRKDYSLIYYAFKNGLIKLPLQHSSLTSLTLQTIPLLPFLPITE